MKKLQDTEQSTGPAKDKGRKYLLWGCVLLCVLFPALLVSQGAGILLLGAALANFGLVLLTRWKTTRKPAIRLCGWLLGAAGGVAIAGGIFLFTREMFQLFLS